LDLVIGGLGKTTLANAVYSELLGQFDRRAFVTVSQNPDVKKVLRDLLYELDNPKFNELSGATLLDERQLIDQLRNSLHTIRYGICVRCTLSSVSMLFTFNLNLKVIVVCNLETYITYLIVIELFSILAYIDI
jgi:hypothetical protein